MRPPPERLDGAVSVIRLASCLAIQRFPGSRSTVVMVSGELDLASAGPLAEHLHRELIGCSRLVVDLRLVTFCGAVGVRALVDVSVSARAYGTTLLVVGANPLTRRIITVCDPARALTLDSPTEEGALL